MPRSTGTYELTSAAGENAKAFIPHPLPPSRPKLDMTGRLAAPLKSAETQLASLEATSRMIPSLDWFVWAFVRKEAVVSSQIEGTQATLDDLLISEAHLPITAGTDHVIEVFNYQEALQYARGQLSRKNGLPLSMRLLNGAHKRLMSGARGQNKRPGSIRRSQNWIGGTRPSNAHHVPPPPHRVVELLGQLEAYLNSEDSLPPVVRVGLVHAQFETIHPYLDGNGRLGRLLIALCLEEWGLLTEPLLYLSLFFKRHRMEYYNRLRAIRISGDWEGWLDYFLEGVTIIAEESVILIRSLFDVMIRDRVRYVGSDRANVVGCRLFENLPQNPIVSVKSAVMLCKTTRPTAAKAIRSLCEVGILDEISGRKRDRIYAYSEYLKLLRTGTELEG